MVWGWAWVGKLKCCVHPSLCLERCEGLDDLPDLGVSIFHGVFFFFLSVRLGRQNKQAFPDIMGGQDKRKLGMEWNGWIA